MCKNKDTRLSHPISKPSRYKPSVRSVAVVLAGLLLAPVVAQAESEWEYLTGDWGGTRKKMSDAGVTLSLNYIGEYMAVTSGGINRKGEYLSRADLGLVFDTEKLFNLKGGTLQILGMRTAGGDPNNHVGSIQGVSNIEAPYTTKIFEAWYDQKFFDDAASVRFGLYDLNTEFDVTETAKLFSNPSFGIGPDYSQSGDNGPSIFPTTSLALRGRYNSPSNVYAQAAVLDAVPGKVGSPRATQIWVDPSEGWLYAVEAGYQTSREEKSKDRYMKFAIGGWRYSVPLNTDVNGAAISDRYSQGVYVVAEAQLYRAAAEGLRGLHGFLRYGQADDKLLQVGSYLGAGLVYVGPFPGRDDDQMGLGVASAENGKTWLAGNPTMQDRETIVELAYRAKIFPWLQVQPDIQYVINPGADPAVENATVMSLRFFVAL